MCYKDFNGILIMISMHPSEYTSFLNEFIPAIIDTHTFTIFGDCESLLRSEHINKHDRLFAPWLNKQYELPTRNFEAYQNRILPVLNQFIDLKKIAERNILVSYPLDNDSDGNRFVLKSLIDLAFSNKKVDEWFIFNNFNYSDFEILNHIDMHLTNINNVAILMDDEDQLNKMSFGKIKLITANKMFKLFQVKCSDSNLT